MTMLRALTVLAIGATAASALTLAPPAAADQVIQGVYAYQQGDLAMEWTVTPSCVPTVGDLREPLQLPVACRLHVTPSSDKVAGGDARLTSGLWQYTTNRKDAVTCPDGEGTATATETIEFDDRTLTGTRMVSWPDACDGALAADLVKYPFTLSYVRPLASPVDLTPLICEPGGLRRCF